MDFTIHVSELLTAHLLSVEKPPQPKSHRCQRKKLLQPELGLRLADKGTTDTT